MDAQRALLDQLMGCNRDGDKPEKEVHDFRDPRVCKYFLCGLCPHDLFQNTKMDMGECENLHINKLRENYLYEKKKNKKSSSKHRIRNYGYEDDLERELTRFLADVDKKIQRANRRLDEQDGSIPGSISNNIQNSASSVSESSENTSESTVNNMELSAQSKAEIENSKEVLEITAEIQELLHQAEEAGNEGEVDLSMQLMEKIETLKLKREDTKANLILAKIRLEQESKNGTNDNKTELDEDTKLKNEILAKNPLATVNVNQKLRVCDVCGAFLSIFDSDRRLADHFGGKLHLGYLQIRQKIEEIKNDREELKERKEKVDYETKNNNDENGQNNSKDGSNVRSASRSRSRRKHKSRSRSRSRSRNRESRYRNRRDERRRSRSRSTKRRR